MLTGIVIGVLGFILGSWRDNSSKVFNKKLEIYSAIVYEISSMGFSRFKIKRQVDKLEKVVSSDGTDKLPEHKVNVDNIKEKIEDMEYKDELIKLFAPARLLGSKEVVNELRNYYSLIEEYFNPESKDSNQISKDIGVSTMRLEQLMRKDLIGFWRRHLSDEDINKHIFRK